MTSKEQRNQFAKESREKFKKAIVDLNFRRAESCIADMKVAGFDAISKQMQKTLDEAVAVDADAKNEDQNI